MAFPRKTRDQIRRSAGVSLPTITIERLDALAGGSGKRSSFVESVLIEGLKSKYGPEWVELADLKRRPLESSEVAA